jgi:hypothetical protein
MPGPSLPRTISSYFRVEGLSPFALQRALELQAAFELMDRIATWSHRDTGRRWLADYHPRALHGFIARYLQLHPERRIV